MLSAVRIDPKSGFVFLARSIQSLVADLFTSLPLSDGDVDRVHRWLTLVNHLYFLNIIL